LADDGDFRRLQLSSTNPYQHTAADAIVERIDADRMQVRFQEPQFGVAPGQAVVFYDGDRVLGGGWIA
jgi:tRNA-specific 2-thiouridylase